MKTDLQKLKEYITTEFGWYIENSPNYGVVPQILIKIEEIEKESEVKQKTIDNETK